MESRMMELMEAIQESEGQAERRVLTLLGGRYISEKALVIDGKIVWESRKNGYFHGYTDEIKNITESGITYIGNEKVFCDTLGQEKQIVICGAGHVSIPVIKMAVMMDCEVIVLEDRPMYADHARMAGASQVICEPFEEALDKIQGSADTYFVILTRGHRYDQICLEKIAAKEHAYIGMIGSRRRTALVKQSLAEKGVDQEVLDAVYTPIGLDIGAQTPAEIGVAIIAEIIEVKNRKKRTYGYSKEIMRALTAQEPYPEKKIMATIITRHGSAPQGLGTKMLIYRDGRCVGTIGGGCISGNRLSAENRIIGGIKKMIEVEVKIPIENIEKIKQKLLETGFIYQKTVVETDTYFTSDHYDMRKKDKALRIRKTENLDTGEVKAQLNCKGPKLDQVSMTRKETEIDIYEPEKMEDILKELEFYPASCRVKKTRCYYIKDHMTAAADKVENLGNFLELEIIVAKEEERAGGLDMIYELMRMLGCEKTETVRDSYLSMLEKRGV